jgi:hypothetical protein
MAASALPLLNADAAILETQAEKSRKNSWEESLGKATTDSKK